MGVVALTAGSPLGKLKGQALMLQSFSFFSFPAPAYWWRDWTVIEEAAVSG